MFITVSSLEGSLLFSIWGSPDQVGQGHPAGPQPIFPSPRRNRPGDREKALAVLLPLVQREGRVAPDLYCMCGRVYKDMFFSSGFQDAGHREQAYHW